MQFFKTHPNNIADIRAAVRAFGQVYFHGDGNMFAQDKNGKWTNSDNHTKFTNEANQAAKYRKLFTQDTIMPRTKEQLDKMLVDAFNHDMASKSAIRDQGPGRVQTFVTDDSDFIEPEAEVDFSAIDRQALANTNRSTKK
jgi:hypothetical protein